MELDPLWHLQQMQLYEERRDSVVRYREIH